jgi:hypothetical protein
MSLANDEIDERLLRLLIQLKPVEPLDPTIAAAERASYLEQVNSLVADATRQTEKHPKEWIDKNINNIHRKVLSPLFSTLLIVLLVIGFLLGGMGTTVHAAQNSLPNQYLFIVKIWSEQVRLSLTDSPEDQLGMVLQFTNRRMSELSEMVAQNDPLSRKWETRFQENLEVALQIAVSMDDPSLQEALAKIRFQAEYQAHAIGVLQKDFPNPSDHLLAQIQARLREQARLAELGESDPQEFRRELRDRDRLHWMASPASTQSERCSQTPTDAPPSNQNNLEPGPISGTVSNRHSQFGQNNPNLTKTRVPPTNSVDDSPNTSSTGSTSTNTAEAPPNRYPTNTPVKNSSATQSNINHPTATPQSPNNQGPGSGGTTATPRLNGEPAGGSATQSPGSKGKP